jgi:hypothetical protein
MTKEEVAFLADESIAGPCALAESDVGDSGSIVLTPRFSDCRAAIFGAFRPFWRPR